MAGICNEVLEIFITHAFKNLVQFGELVDVVLEFANASFLGGLDFDFDNVTSLAAGIDLTFASIACVVDHPTIPTVVIPRRDQRQRLAE